MGFNKSNPTNPTNPSNSYGYTGGESGGENWSRSDPDSIWGPQGKYLEQLYGMGMGLANNFSPYMNRANSMYESAAGLFDSLSNPGMNPQLGLYSNEVQRNLEENLLPSIQGESGGFGQMGGSRQGVAEGLALSRGNQQIRDMASQLYSEDRNRQMQAMQFAPTLMQAGMGMPWYAMNQLSGILGRPTVLGGGSESGGSNWGSYGGENWGWGGGGGGGGGGFGLTL